MKRKLSPRAQRLIVALAPDEAFILGSKELEPEHVILALIKSGDGLGFISLKTLRINVLTLQLAIEQNMNAGVPKCGLGEAPHSRRLLAMLENADSQAESLGCDFVGTEHIVLACILEDNSLVKKYFEKANISYRSARDVVADIERKIPSSAKIGTHESEDGSQEMQAYMSDGSANNDKKINKQGILGQFTNDLTERAANGSCDPVIGRKDEIARLVQVLCRRTKNNPILVGEPGVGKTAVVEGLAQLISSGDVPKDLLGKKILCLDLAAMVAGTKYRGEFEERMKRLMKEVKENPSVILFVDEIHTIIGAGGPEGSMDASNMLKPALSRGELQVIGATTTKEYRKYFEKDSALARRFQKINVEEPDLEETERILFGLKEKYEDFHRVSYNQDVIPLIVRLSDRYITERCLPDKAIDIMDEAGAAKKIDTEIRPKEMIQLEESIKNLTEEKKSLVAKQDYENAAMVRDKVLELKSRLEECKKVWKNSIGGDKKTVELSDIEAIVSRITGIPADHLGKEESRRFVEMEKIIHQEIIGQEEAVSLIASTVRRSRAGVSNKKRPMGSFIFLGPTGVGKTQLAKVLAKFLFGTEDALIRVDMSDFMEKHNASRLVGAPPGYVGYDEGGLLTEKVRQHPYSVVLLDEIEKAHPDVFNLLLQLLEEGELNDNLGHTVSFRNTLVLMTSNAGAREINASSRVGFSTLEDNILPYEDIKANAVEQLKRIIAPELLNRIDDVVVFSPLSREEVAQILNIQLDELAVRLAEQNIKITVKPKARSWLCDKGYDPQMGARPMRRLIQQTIEDKLAVLLLNNVERESDSVVVDLAGDELTVKFMKKKISRESKIIPVN